MPPFSCFTAYQKAVVPKRSRRALTHEDVSTNMLHTMFTSIKISALRRDVAAQLPTHSWSEAHARHLFDRLVQDLNSGAGEKHEMGKPMQKAYNNAKDGTIVHQYPNLKAASLSVTALGMLWIVLPEAVAALGFVELEPTEGLLYLKDLLQFSAIADILRLVRCCLAAHLFEHSIQHLLCISAEPGEGWKVERETTK